MLITQVNRTITSDFTELESQYSSNTVIIDVDFTDTTFDGYTKYASIKIKTFSTYNYHIPIENNQIKLPAVALNYAGVITLSIYGIKTAEEETITTNIVTLNVVASNPTGEQATPISDDWVTIMQQYANAEIIRLGGNIAPSINEETNNWWIGEYDTGIRAKGDVCTIDPITKNWLINGIDTGVLAQGTADVPIATQYILGGIKVGNTLKAGTDGTLNVKEPTLVNVTLLATDWDGVKPYTYSLSVTGVTTTSNQEIIPATNITEEQFDMFSSAKVIGYSQDTDLIILKALGDKPTVDIPITVMLRGEK